jgi:hypothetical protein
MDEGSAPSRLVDATVTAALLLLGVAGFVMALGFPQRAAIWPASVMGLLVLFCLVHLVSLARKRGPAERDVETE